jgi:N-acetylmuramoyl-L-alanine amidase
LKNRRLFFIAFILFFVPAYPSSGRIHVFQINNRHYVDCNELASVLGLGYSFDMVSCKGKLYLKNHNAVYGVGLSSCLIDGALYRSVDAVIRANGKVFIPEDVCEVVIRSFLPAAGIRRVSDVLIVGRSHGEEAVPAGKNMYSHRSSDRLSFIVIDPGHGGKDPGAVGKAGLKEKDITLKIARYLEKKLNKKLVGMHVHMTRHDDRFIELSQRTDIANGLLRKNENGIFISIHVNSSLSNRISGYETFFLSPNPTNEEARNTAALENNVVILEEKSKSADKSYEDVDYIEAMMITTQIQKESSTLARSIQAGMARHIRFFGSRGVKKADFFVLRGVLMPAALIEIGFITNKKEARYLNKSSHQKMIADGIAEGVELFIKRYNRLLKITR